MHYEIYMHDQNKKKKKTLTTGLSKTSTFAFYEINPTTTKKYVHSREGAILAPYNTPYRRQSKALLTIDERGSKITRNSVFYCHLSPAGRQMAIKTLVSNDF